MTELGEIFAELGISHYLHDFVEQGFDTWDTILDITESDFDALNVKLGHRRKIQRKIAQSRGLSSDRALASPSRNTPTDDRPIDETKGGGHRADANTSSGGTQGAKRKYRRHPKPDENAPERPPSAYVIFSNKMREDLKGKPLSFTEIAKLVGENWQNLAPHEREPFEQQAFTAKEKYNAELVEYKKTEQYKEYSQYLVDFKARQSHQQQADAEVTKRPKLEPQVSTASTGTTSSGASIHGSEPPSGRKRDDSAATNGSWSAGTRQLSPTSQSPTLTNVSGIQAGAQLSPNPTSPTVLPGYRDSVVYGATLQARPPARREAKPRDETVIPMHQLPRLSDPSDMRMSFDRHNINNNRGDSLNMTGALQHAHRTGQGQPPPLLASESTSGTTRSSGSSASTSSYLPRTPMEPSVDRSLPIPNMYSQKPYELPPLRPPSLSPQNSILNPQQSPHNIPSYTDFPSTMAPMRGHTAINSRQQRPLPSANTIDDTVLDPVSALIKAGEIVDRNSRPRPPS